MMRVDENSPNKDNLALWLLDSAVSGAIIFTSTVACLPPPPSRITAPTINPEMIKEEIESGCVQYRRRSLNSQALSSIDRSVSSSSCSNERSTRPHFIKEPLRPAIR